MLSHQRRFSLISGVLPWLLVLTAWLALAPLQFGGRVAYILVNGNSMAPTLHKDDLLLLRPAPQYTTGDIVAYRDPQIGPVIHRIIKQQDSHFTMRGDHNTFTDPYHPTSADVIGKLWLRVPKLGKYVAELRTPLNLTILSSIIGTIAMVTITDHPKASLTPPKQRRISHPQNPIIFDLLVILGVIALGFLGLGGFALTRPLDRAVTETLDYQHSGQFTYMAPAPSDIYDAGTVQPGDPIFRQLIDQVTVGFHYQLTTLYPASVAGTYRLLAELSSADGWKRTLELQPETPFNGLTCATTGQLNLLDIQLLIDNLEERTGVHRNTYKITIIPQVMVSGQLGGQSFEDTFAPHMVLEISPLQLQLVHIGEGNPLHPSELKDLKRASSEPNTLSLLGQELKISMVRQIALVGIILTLSAVEVLGLLVFWTTRGDESARIQLKYGGQLVAVQDYNPLRTNAKIITVGSIDDLIKIAETHNSMIMHQTQGMRHRYFVQNDKALFYYPAHNSATTMGERS